MNASIVGERPTGLGVYAQGLIAALADQGEELDVFTSHPAAIAGAATRIERVPNAVRPERGPLAHLARIAWLQSVLPRRLARSQPAILLNVVPEGPLLCPVPQVTIVHDLIPLLYPTASTRSALYFRYVVPFLLRASRAVIADSEATRRDVLACYSRVAPERVHVVHPGYDAGRFVPEPDGSRNGPRYLLYVGNIAPHKNLIRLVEAFAAMLPQTSATLVIRGSGRPRHVAALRQRIEELRLGDRVDWRPYESAVALPELYRGARAVVLPSLHEGFGLTALEAMACGTPVIAARAASIPEVVGDAACLVDPFDTGSLATMMLEVLQNDALAADLRERGRKQATRFSWERTARLVRSHLGLAAQHV